MSEGNEAARLDGPVLDHARHVCVLYHSTDEEFRVLHPFIADSFKKGDRAFHIIPGVADLMEYCTRLNDVVPTHEATVGCTYDLAKFSARAVIDVLRCPFYGPSDELMRELRERRESRRGMASVA
jgi:hypothetical protein